MASVGDWGDIIDEAEAERFVGREQEVANFRQHISLAKPRYLIFYVSGQGGAGKTTLLNRYRNIAEGHGFLLADSDEQQRDVPAVLGRFAQQLTDQDVPLKHFNERYKTYRQKMHEIENDPEAPQGLAAVLARTVVRAAFISGDAIPGVRRGLEYAPRETVETQASEWATYLAKKFANKDEVALLREPVSILTPLFFDDLNEIAQKRKVLLCFDNFEATRSELQEWLLRLREYKPSLNIRIAIASRNSPGAKWDPLQRVTQTIRIDVFSEQEAESFLNTYNITSPKRRKEILELSGRLPVLMSWLAAAEGQEPETDPLLPTHDIVERFLRWVTDPDLKQVALLAAIPHSFNVDLLKLLLENRKLAIDEQATFDWLQNMPFVRQRADGWYYHDVVRRIMLRYQRQKSPQTYREMHTTLADFYDTSRKELYASKTVSEEEQWTNAEWQKDTLAYVYHFLAAQPQKNWEEILSLFVVAIRKRRTFAVEMIELLNAEDVYDELTSRQNEDVRLFYQQMQAIKEGDVKGGFEMFDRLCKTDGLSAQAKGYAFAYRGECNELDRKWEKALQDFGKALQYIPSSAWVFASRGRVYGQMERYQEALTDFDQIVTLDNTFAYAFAARGQTQRLLGHYQEALADLDRAIALNEKDAWAFINRGLIYRAMKRYEDALADLNKAIALNDKYIWAFASRGDTYRLMGRYEDALADFSQMIALNGKDAWAFANRGAIYRMMNHYQEALTDLDQALALNEKYAWAFAQRGLTYRQMGRYEEALADLERIIELGQESDWIISVCADIYLLLGSYEEALVFANRAIILQEKNDWCRYTRALIYMLTDQTSAFESDMQTAIVLAQAALDNEPGDWRVAFNLAIYYLVNGNRAEAESQYNQLISSCSSLEAFVGAVEDLTDFLRLLPSNELAQQIRTQLQTRIAELEQTPVE